MPSVKKWLDDVNAILEEVQKLQQELEGGPNKCFNVSLRYSLAKRMENKAKQMTDLKQNSSFEPFSQLIQLPGITYFSSKEFMAFNSRKSTYNRLLEAIINGKNKMVGLYGIGGSGKTTLAKEVGKKVDELKLFDKVIMVVVSKPLNIMNIQQEIAGQIGLQLQEPTQLTKAQRLSEGLKNKKILIILDDVWSKLKLEDIGIPTTGGCHILLTTRLRYVCVSMDCESKIELLLLTEEEAWALFKMHANTTSVSTNEFDSIGRKIVDECKGLPIAIVTVGSTLKEKSIHTWRSTLERLRHPPPLDIEDDLKTPYVTLKVSYDNLSSPLAKSLFILCSMFPEDHEIHIEDLIRFGKGTLKLGERIYTMEKTRDRVLANIEKLLDSCLLMYTSKQAHVKLHDVVRDVALWTAKEKCQEVLVDNQEISEMLIGKYQSLEDTKAVSLWNLDKHLELSKQLHFPKLEILLLQPYGFIRDIEAMESLKVLALVRHGFEWELRRRDLNFCLIPQSIVSLTNLHTLCLRGKILGDVSLLGELKGLEILDLRGSLFDELPIGIVDMKMLKLLDIFGCQIEKSPLEVIGRCEQLEELYFWDHKSVILEILSLSNLKSLEQVFQDSSIGCSLPMLQELWIWSCPELRICIFSHATITSLPKLRKLHIGNYDKVKWLLSCSLASYCPLLKEIIISHCSEFERLIDEKAAHGDPLLHDKQYYPYGKETDSAYVGVIAKRFNQLQNEQSLILFLRLKSLQIVRSGKKKEDISISSCSEFEGLIDEEAAHGDPLVHDMQDHPQQPLIRNCSELERLAEEASYGDRLPLLKLKYLSLRHEQLTPSPSKKEFPYGFRYRTPSSPSPSNAELESQSLFL
ncbi:disease resistance protein At4g27190-like [Neltuma alba]|uniref:disease resistance protein At4g27190-like n=1 Tax=Neltuma alba TaxID=207710 RepID=UPI0010A3E426|nr:disease resistance protein At4g27190-like [Prosopis alba]